MPGTSSRIYVGGGRVRGAFRQSSSGAGSGASDTHTVWWFSCCAFAVNVRSKILLLWSASSCVTWLYPLECMPIVMTKFSFVSFFFCTLASSVLFAPTHSRIRWARLKRQLLTARAHCLRLNHMHRELQRQVGCGGSPLVWIVCARARVCACVSCA